MMGVWCWTSLPTFLRGKKFGAKPTGVINNPYKHPWNNLKHPWFMGYLHESSNIHFGDNPTLKILKIFGSPWFHDAPDPSARDDFPCKCLRKCPLIEDFPWPCFMTPEGKSFQYQDFAWDFAHENHHRILWNPIQLDYNHPLNPIECLCSLQNMYSISKMMQSDKALRSLGPMPRGPCRLAL